MIIIGNFVNTTLGLFLYERLTCPSDFLMITFPSIGILLISTLEPSSSLLTPKTDNIKNTGSLHKIIFVDLNKDGLWNEIFQRNELIDWGRPVMNLFFHKKGKESQRGQERKTCFQRQHKTCFQKSRPKLSRHRCLRFFPSPMSTISAFLKFYFSSQGFTNSQFSSCLYLQIKL